MILGWAGHDGLGAGRNVRESLVLRTRKGLAMGLLAGSGSATGRLVFLPLARLADQNYGWRAVRAPSGRNCCGHLVVVGSPAISARASLVLWEIMRFQALVMERV